MTDTTRTETKLTFERLMEILAEKIAAKVCEDPRRLYPRSLTVTKAARSTWAYIVTTLIN